MARLKSILLTHEVCPKESVVGWFSTGKEIRPSSIVIHTCPRGAVACFWQPPGPESSTVLAL